MPKHTETKQLPFTPQQMFDLVSDVAHYPEFLPWCVATRIRRQNDVEMIADMVIGFRAFRESFTSRVALRAPHEINVSYENGPFKYLINNWKFTTNANGCEVNFSVDFQFKSRILDKAIGVVFEQAVHRMVSAFESRASTLYTEATNTIQANAKSG